VKSNSVGSEGRGKLSRVTRDMNEPVLLFAGPRGSSDERAGHLFAQAFDSPEVLPLRSLEQVVSTVDSTVGCLGVVPLEDSLHGEFTQAVARLLFNTTNTCVTRTLVLTEKLWVQTLDATKPPMVAHSHSSILERFAPILDELGIVGVSAPNTTEACRIVAAQGNPLHVALAPDVVASQFSLVHHQLMASSAVDVTTRYGLLGRGIPEPLEGVETLALICPLEDRVGTLARIMDIFRLNGVNLVSLRSINVGAQNPHMFLVELAGHPVEDSVAAAVVELFKHDVFLKIVGVCTPASLAIEDHPVRNVPAILTNVDEYQSWIDTHSAGPIQ
jgi:prephenate dehydratase